MPCAGLSQGPATSSTPEFCQMQDQGLQILWSETGKESDRAIRFPLRITLGGSCLGGPSLLLSQSFSIAAYRNVTRKGTPKRSSGAVHLQELTTRELRENIEARCDTIAGVLKVMGEEGGLIRRRKGIRKVLWRLADNGQHERTNDEDKPLKTGSRFETGSQKSKTPGIGSVDRKEKTCPVENQTVPVSPPIYARAGTNLFSTGRNERTIPSESPRRPQQYSSIRRSFAGTATIRECVPPGRPDRAAECSDCAAHRPKATGCCLRNVV